MMLDNRCILATKETYGHNVNQRIMRGRFMRAIVCEKGGN